MTDNEELFDADPLHVPGRAMSAGLQAMHKAGRTLLEALCADPASAVTRTRDAAVLVGYPERAFQVTVRATTPGGEHADEWLAMGEGRVLEFAYGWVLGRRLERAVVLRAPVLVADIIERPGCLVPATRTTVKHHAPGGAEFYVVDIRRCRPEVLIRSQGYAAADLVWHTAPTTTQDELW